MHRQRLAILIAAGVGVLGFLLPWTSMDMGFFGSVNQCGFQIGWTGWATLAGIGAAAGILFKAADKKTPIDNDTKKVVLGGGVAAVLFPLIAMITSKTSGVMGFSPSLGTGVFICLLAGLGIVAVPFVVKDNGDFEMPTKDSIKEEIREIKED